MTKFLAAAFLAAVALPALAQTAAAPAPVDLAALERVRPLREAALTDDYAWDFTEDLTTEVGPRPAGTAAEARGRDWAVRRLRAMDFANVRVEPFTMPVWVRGAESASITAPYPQPLVLAALGNSASTAPQGLEAEVVGFASVEALRAAPAGQVRGKIVYITHAMPRTQDGSGYGAFGAARRQGPTVASQKGAAAIVIRSIGTDWHRNPHTGVQTFGEGAQPIPAAALANPDADQLDRILQRSRQPVRMRLTLLSRTLPNQASGNVIAEVPGRDRAAPPILVSCHLDSWDQGTGAIDDAAGCGIVTAAAKRIMDAGRPLRPIRIVFFGAEEVGLFGGLDYRAKWGKTPHYAIAESDFGADRIWKVDSRLGADRAVEARLLQKALEPLGIAPGSLNEANGSDIGPMLADGLPGIGLSQDGTRYFDLHHTPDDTLDKIDKAQLRQNVAAWTTMLAVLSGGIEQPRGKRR
ncbi:M28 family peptidase [Sphingomonas sp. GCM10030256]|uniref:M28 family peptidase n=1 Tax=Sphingomonas sp. GCM10030256 TaxID=3273427 RepID=UPI0036227051